jgi:hypothetical protein
MKYYILLVLTLAGLKVQGQRSSVKGVISIMNSKIRTGKRQYVVNAEIKDDSKRAGTTETDQRGFFELIYLAPDKTPVTFSIRKNRLKVVEEYKLHAKTGDDTIYISMVDPDSIPEFRNYIFDIGKTNGQKLLDAFEQRRFRFPDIPGWAGIRYRYFRPCR